jgi:hypothetical protein
MESIGEEDMGKWMPFIFNMGIVEAAKLTSDEKDLPTYNCTTVFTNSGEAYIIDTPYEKFFSIFKEYNEEFPDDGADLTIEDNLEL